HFTSEVDPDGNCSQPGPARIVPCDRRRARLMGRWGLCLHHSESDRRAKIAILVRPWPDRIFLTDRYGEAGPAGLSAPKLSERAHPPGRWIDWDWGYRGSVSAN